MNISLIGHNGALGKAVLKRIPSAKILSRFPSISFLRTNLSKDTVINCAVAKKGLIKTIVSNILLPIYLSLFSKRYIHICTDCVYDKRDSSIKTPNSRLKIDSLYSFSKIVSWWFLKHRKNTLIIRTSFMSK
jgi:dTDP-4-dehydrorhamnose reductase